MIDRLVANPPAARPPRLILTGVLAAGAAFGFAMIVFLTVVGPRELAVVSATLPPSWPLLFAGSASLLAAWHAYRAFFRRLGWPLRWPFALTLGAALGSLTFFLPDGPPHFNFILLAALLFGPFLVAEAAIFAPKRQQNGLMGSKNA